MSTSGRGLRAPQGLFRRDGRSGAVSLRAFAGGLLLSVVVGMAVFVGDTAWFASHFSGESLLFAIVVLTVSLVLHECAHALVAALLDF